MGRIPKAPWDAQSSAASGIGERAPSVAASSTGGWGHISKAPWDAESSAASSVGVGGGDGKGRGKSKGKGKKGPSKAPSEAASSTGGWGHIPKAPWDDPSVRAPSVAGGDDDDTKTINGDEPREKKGGRNNSNKPHMKSWADQVEDEGVW